MQERWKGISILEDERLFYPGGSRLIATGDRETPVKPECNAYLNVSNGKLLKALTTPKEIAKSTFLSAIVANDRVFRVFGPSIVDRPILNPHWAFKRPGTTFFRFWIRWESIIFCKPILFSSTMGLYAEVESRGWLFFRSRHLSI